MVLEKIPPSFSDWLLHSEVNRTAAVQTFVWNGALLALAALAIGYLCMAFRYGPLVGGDVTYRFVRGAFFDLLAVSPRRIWALARLAWQESWRRHIWVALLVYAVILSFAKWFLDSQSNDPIGLYLDFVLTATTYLVLLVALFLSAFSLPADIKSRTIHTVVTKPVRAGEIVLGRMIGFTLIGTAMLAVMGTISYIFVVRALGHTHGVEPDSFKTDEKTGAVTGMTTLAQGHRHQFTLTDGKTGDTDTKQGHFHDVHVEEQNGKKVYVVGPTMGGLLARVPIYGKLHFLDRTGARKEKGINTGNEWTYRSFIEGGTPSAAVWTFTGVAKERFPDGLPVDMDIRVFRSYKGDIEAAIKGQLLIRNPAHPERYAIETFRAKEYQIDRINIGLELTDANGKPLDLYKDLVDDGKVEIVLQCTDPAQYFGAAQPDMYLLAREAPFSLNFVKGHLGIWVQMTLVIGMGVMFSTFLNGAVAMLATIGCLVIGFFADFIDGVYQGINNIGAVGAIRGGGPIESLIRLVKQQNVITELEEGFSRTVIQNIDIGLMKLLEGAVDLLPKFGRFRSVEYFNNVDYVRAGFDVPPDVLLTQLTLTATYLLVFFLAGYLLFRSREVAS